MVSETMLPLASSSGFAIITVVVLAAILIIWWLLRSEARDDAVEKGVEDHDNG